MLHRSSSHPGLAEAVELARALGRLPAALELIGIEGSSFEAGRGLAPQVELAAEQVAGRLAGTLRLAARGVGVVAQVPGRFQAGDHLVLALLEAVEWVTRGARQHSALALGALQRLLAAAGRVDGEGVRVE